MSEDRPSSELSHAPRERTGGPATGEPPTRDLGPADPDLTEETVLSEEKQASRPRRDDYQPLARGTAVGRYTILELLGTGGMGAVYAAHDPELDRRVALKLLRVDDDADAGVHAARLLREAKALAHVSHPNVVAVFDAGRFGESVFIATELVEGKNLSEWLREDRPPRREILRALVAAGRGLAAAHRAGLVHRDFKPQNVVVGTRGEIRVIDFGLVRVAGAIESAVPADSATPTGRHLDEQLTAFGVVIGTPRYMAPEQHLGEDVDGRADQFSFGVTLYEALYGTPPFSGKTYARLRHQILTGQVRPPPDPARVPAWLRRITLRALELEPEARFPDMPALLAAIEGRPRRVRRTWLAVGAATALVCAVLLGAALTRSPAPSATPCADAAARLEGVWDRQRKAQARQAFVASGAPYGGELFAGVARELDDHARQWRDMYGEACRATRVHGTQSEALLDLRMYCLERRRGELRALVDSLTEISRTEVIGSASAAGRLSPIAACADRETLLAAYPLPVDAAGRARVRELDRVADELRAKSLLGRYRSGHALAVRFVEQARDFGYPPKLAAALHELSLFDLGMGDTAAALEHARETIRAAASARDDALAAQAWAHLVWTHRARGELERATVAAEAAEAAAIRAGGAPRLRAEAMSARAAVLFDQGQVRASRELFERCVELYVQVHGARHQEVARAIMNVAELRVRERDFATAEHDYRLALDIILDVLGPRHPDVAYARASLGDLELARGDTDAAIAHFRAAAELRRAVLGPEHPETLAARTQLADAEARAAPPEPPGPRR